MLERKSYLLLVIESDSVQIAVLVKKSGREERFSVNLALN